MSIKVMTYLWEYSRQKGSALLLLLAIADHAHDDGEGAYPSVKTLAGKVRMTERNVQRLLNVLEASDELEIQRGAGPKGCNLFRVTFSIGVQSRVNGVTSRVKRGDIDVTQTVIEPSLRTIREREYSGQTNSLFKQTKERLDKTAIRFNQTQEQLLGTLCEKVEEKAGPVAALSWIEEAIEIARRGDRPMSLFISVLEDAIKAGVKPEKRQGGSNGTHKRDSQARSTPKPLAAGTPQFGASERI